MSNTTQEDNKRENNGLTIGRAAAGLVMGLSTALFVAMLVTGDEMDFIFAFTAIFWAPILLIGLGVFIFNIVRLCIPNKRNIFNRLIVIWGLINILLAVGVWFHDKHISDQVDAEHLIAHYEQYEAEIWDLAEYTRSAMDSGTWMRLEFDGDKVEMFHTQTADGDIQNRWSGYREPPLDPDTIGLYIGLTHDEIEGIRQRLEKAGCISIELTNYGNASTILHNGKEVPVDEFDWVNIGRKRHSMSMFFYVLFRHPMSDSTWNKMLENVTLIPINDTMALEYGSPAFGSFGYPQREAIIERLNIKERRK